MKYTYEDVVTAKDILTGRAKKEAVVCAECFAELCNSMSEIGSREEQEIRKEWEASDEYDKRKEESPDGRI